MTPETKPAAPKTESKKPVAKKGPSPDINKSAEIRKVADAMKAKNEKPRPVVIIEILKKQGVEVSSPQVSIVLKKMGFQRRKRRSKETAGPKGVASATAKKSSNIKVEDLVKAQKVVAQFGSVDRALAAIQALRNFR